jgi:hypothetical protein
MEDLNIVDLIENNPITKLSDSYNNKLLIKIKNNFTEYEQQIFITSFYCYLNYNSNTDFVIDLDDIWKWLGFQYKVNAKRLLEKNFNIDIDYKKLLIQKDKQDNIKQNGGHNKETFMMTVKTFKSYCLKAGTKKADEIHEYFLKLEDILHEVIEEESSELKLQLEKKDKLLENSEKEKHLLREKTLLEQFVFDTPCVYYGIIDNKSNTEEKLIKFGCSNFLSDRVDRHKKTYTNFCLINAFKVDNNVQIENAIKNHSILKKKRRIININKVNYTELLALDNMSFEDLDKIIKKIIEEEYDHEKLLKENEKLKMKNIFLIKENEKLNASKLNEEYKDFISENLLLTEENEKLKKENIVLMRKLNKYKNKNNEETDESVKEEINLCSYCSTFYKNDNNINLLKNIHKKKDGLYYIDNKIYTKLVGSRIEVWSEKAYKTSGGLVKEDLLSNKSGKIVSKKKFISEKQNNRLEEVNKLRSKNE